MVIQSDTGKKGEISNKLEFKVDYVFVSYPAILGFYLREDRGRIHIWYLHFPAMANKSPHGNYIHVPQCHSHQLLCPLDENKHRPVESLKRGVVVVDWRGRQCS